MKTNEFRQINYAVNVAFKNYEKRGRKLQEIWAEGMHENFAKGYYDLAYEFVAMQELLLFKMLSKTDPFRLKVWRMFVVDFRRAFSDYEFEKFERLKAYKII